MKKGPKTKWMTAIEQRQIPNIIFFTIQDITCFFSGLPETLCDIILAVQGKNDVGLGLTVLRRKKLINKEHLVSKPFFFNILL